MLFLTRGFSRIREFRNDRLGHFNKLINGVDIAGADKQKRIFAHKTDAALPHNQIPPNPPRPVLSRTSNRETNTRFLVSLNAPFSPLHARRAKQTAPTPDSAAAPPRHRAYETPSESRLRSLTEVAAETREPRQPENPAGQEAGPPKTEEDALGNR